MRNELIKPIITAAVLCVAFSGCATRPLPLYAGTGKVDITPAQPVISAEGQSFRLPDNTPPEKRTPLGNVHDPLYARVVVLKNKNVSFAIVSADLMLFSSKRVIDEARKRWSIEHVILSATHTHSGMVPRGLCPTAGGWEWRSAEADPGELLNWPALSEDPWYAETEDKIIAAIGEAAGNLFPARLAAGKGTYESIYLGHNRRLIRPAHGVVPRSVITLWDNPTRMPTTPSDPTVGVIRIEDEARKPRAFMVHYACHPISMMGSSMITADFPGAMTDYIERQLGDSCMAMFLQGAAGDINPYETNMRGAYGLNMTRQAGIALAKAALGVSENLPSPEEPKAVVQVKESMLDIADREGNKSSAACVASVVINRDLALVAMPGEIFVQHQLNLSERSSIPNTFLLGIAYCGLGSPFLNYIPTAQAVEEGGYGATQFSFVAADAGDRMVDAAVAAIDELVGE